MAKKSIISTKEITKILTEFSYKANEVMFQITGEHVWIPTNQPLDMSLPLKSIRMSELVPIRTESELRNLIKTKLNN